jgi:hypothetical protein
MKAKVKSKKAKLRKDFYLLPFAFCLKNLCACGSEIIL